MQEFYTSLGMLLGGMLATLTPYIVKWVKSRVDKEKEGKSFIQNTSYRAKINEALIEIRAYVGANRVSIVEYHNGIVSTNGLPFNYSSVTYENVDFTTREIMMDQQKLPISPVSKLLLDIHNCTKNYIRIGSDFKDQKIVTMNKYYGIETNYIFKIGNHIKDGIVNVSWVHEDAALTDEEIEFISLKVKYIHEIMKKMIKY